MSKEMMEGVSEKNFSRVVRTVVTEIRELVQIVMKRV